MLPPLAIFVLQFLWFLFAWSLIVSLVLWPLSARLSPDARLSAWVAPEMFRVLGLGLLVPNLSPGMPSEFAYSTAAGDSLTALLAALAFLGLRRGWRPARGIAWACTVVGTLAASDPDSGETFTYSIPGGSDAFEIVDNKLVVKDLGDALTYDVKVLATDSGGLTVEKTFRITTTDDDGNPLGSAGTITIDASNAESMDFEAYIRGGFEQT